jgi:hypothetical protein
MKKLAFVVVGAAALAVAACGKNNADQLNESEAQNFEAGALNDLAANAANAEVEALGTQEQQLEAEKEALQPANDAAPAADSNTTDPTKVEADVQGM